jgi:hypothetical protein
VSIVEGDGERAAVLILIRRIAAEIGVYGIHVYTTVLTKRNRFPRIASERETRLREARIAAGDDGAILILLDSDGEPPCVDIRHQTSPCVLGADLVREIGPLTAGLPVAVVMAECEFETWFVAAAPSLTGSKGLVPGTIPPDCPDSLGDPKGWLTARMMNSDRAYSPTADQARFTERFDMEMARQWSPSFDHCYREIERLIRAVCQT